MIEILVRRPVFAWALALVFLLLGVVGLLKLPVRQFPDVGSLYITVETAYPGAGARVLEEYVSTPLMAAIAGLQEIDTLSAENEQGKSVITVKLREGSDPDRALTRINTQVTSVLWKLPRGVLSPVVSENLSTNPCIFLSFKSDTETPEGISDVVDREVVPRLLSLPGVRTTMFHGRRTPAMRIRLDPVKMAALNLTPLEVSQALERQNVRSTAGRIHAPMREYNVHLDSALSTAGAFENLVVAGGPGRLIRLGDVGRAEAGSREARVSAIEGKGYVVVMGVVPHERANGISVSREVLRVLPEIRAALPGGISVEVPWIPANISMEAVKTVLSSAWVAVACVLLVIFLFLGSWRSILVPSVTIPFSLVSACALLALMDMSLNTLTLLGGVLAIGLVVDDAIVVVENTHRHMDKGLSPREAAIAGTREIWLPLLGMTLTVAVVFLPIFWMPGLTGALFHPFAFVVATTVLLSGFFALTLSPVMSATLLRPVAPGSLAARVDGISSRASKHYGNWLSRLMDRRAWVGLAALLILASGAWLFGSTHAELMPDENQGVILGIGIGPTSANLEYSEKIAREIGAILEEIPEKKGYAVICGWPGQVNRITSLMALREPRKGDRSEAEILKELRPKFANITGAESFVINRPPLLDILGVTQPVNFVLQTSGTYEELNRSMEILLARARSHGGFVGAHADLNLDKPGISFSIRRDRAEDLGVSVADITETLNLLLGEPILGWFARDGRGYPVVPAAEEEFRQNPEALKNIRVRTASGKLVPITDLLDWEMAVEPQTRNQFQQMRSATLTANLARGFTLGDALAFLNRVVDEELPHGIARDTYGPSREFERSGGKLLVLFLLSLAAIYLLLAAQFNSLTDPLLIMVSVPLCLTGALLTMKLTGATLNIYTEIGLLMLMGLISKHGILILNFTRKETAGGAPLREAVLKAAETRLRPILMTTCAMVFGAVPLALARGGGHESLNQIGAVLIGGLLVGTLLTLFVLPVLVVSFAGKSS